MIKTKWPWKLEFSLQVLVYKRINVITSCRPAKVSGKTLSFLVEL